MSIPFTTETSEAARKQSEIQRSIYTRKFLDDDCWVELARQAGVNLPMYYARPTDSEIKSWLRQLGISWTMYIEAYGWNSADEFEKMNPKFSMRPLAGLILELWDEKRRLKSACKQTASARGVNTSDITPNQGRYPKGVPKAKRAPIPGVSNN